MKKYHFYLLIGSMLLSGGQVIACLANRPFCYVKNSGSYPVGALVEGKVEFCQLPHGIQCYPCQFDGDEEKGNAACTAAVAACAGGGCVLGTAPF